ncbi:MAG: hypothetical protein JWP97_6237 [Labilithrix sp.]|nr:hypothetical protein [Labilithrix sp.]
MLRAAGGAHGPRGPVSRVPGVRDVPRDAPGLLAPLLLLEGTLAVRVRAAIDEDRAGRWADGVRAARDAWFSDFDGAQFSVGRAWYTHLEQGRSGDYFAGAAVSDALVERTCPGLQDAMRALASRVVGVPVAARAGWCGPGVHVFPAGGLVAREGGDVHVDAEGLTPAHALERAPALTLVVMLAPPASGGGLRVWDVVRGASDEHSGTDLARSSAVCDYRAGDLVIIDSYRLHQIQPFAGELDRISVTCHAALVGGQWETWF